MLANVLKCSLIVGAITAAYGHGYLVSGTQEPVRSAYGDCWRTGSWTEESASQECDPQLALKEVPKRASFATEVLFDFEQAELDADGRKVLDDVASKLLAMDIEKVTASAHADRIGGAEYNQRLSARRAAAIRVYLVEKGVPEKVLQFENKGAREPVTVGRCESMGPETKHNVKLVACLQPDRRVDIELVGKQKARDLAAHPG